MFPMSRVWQEMPYKKRRIETLFKIQIAMKKIIELAERVLYYAGRSLTLSYDEATEYLACRDKLKQALTERHQLEQTPITEEWLKEHGGVHNSTLYRWEIWSEDNGTVLAVTKAYGKWHITNTCIEVSSLANLYDALDLCGIKID